MLDPHEFVSEILPNGLWNKSEDDSGKPCVVCILCNVNFDKDAPWSECQHWVPGWLAKDVSNAEELSKLWADEFEDRENARLVHLHQMRESTLDDQVAATLEHDIASCEIRVSNYREMAQILMAEHGVFFHDTCSDGNCALDMLWHLQKPAESPCGSDDHVLPEECAAMRGDLQANWESVVDCPKWRVAFCHLCSGHLAANQGSEVDQGQSAQADQVPGASCEEVQSGQGDQPTDEVLKTPPRSKRQKEDCPFTPDPVDKKGTLLAAQEVRDGIVVIPAANMGQEAVKKRRTGKPGDIQTKINVDEYVGQLLADKEITYKLWLKKHKECMVIVFPGLIF